MPPTTSEWPPRYLVAECTTTSAPCSKGRWSAGVAKVLSTTRIAPWAWATSAIAVMSRQVSSGLVGVSSHTIVASSGQLASSLPGSVRSKAR